MQLNENTKNMLESLIKSDKVVLFMKGNRLAPQCGFSAQVVQILDELLEDYTTVNVLEDMNIREGIKAYAQWPTIPQLYVENEFVGGCDIVKEMFASGELHKTLGIENEDIAPPSIEITDPAKEAILAAMKNSNENECLHLKISSDFENQLSISEKDPQSIEVLTNGLKILVAKSSAKRANGLQIDYVKNADGEGFRLNNPNAPAPIIQISPKDVVAMREKGEIFDLIDVRPQNERDIALISWAKALHELPADYFDKLDKNHALIFHCRSGGRSQRKAEEFRKKGFKKLYNLEGGILAWSDQVDSSLRKY